MNKLLSIILVLVSFNSIITSQVKDYELGSSRYGIPTQTGGYFDYSDPETVNIKVSIWGNCKFPGRYLLPINTTVSDFISFAGGPTDAADLDDLRIYRIGADSTQQMLKFSYNDLLWEEELNININEIPILQASDVLLIPGSPRLYFKDWFSMGLSVFSALISLSILILNIAK